MSIKDPGKINPRARYNTVRLRVTDEMKQGFRELGVGFGTDSISETMQALMSIGLAACMRPDVPLEPSLKKAVKRFWKEHWDRDGLISVPTDIFDKI
jgi:hypothetical protein